jgi:hypothetical protein
MLVLAVTLPLTYKSEVRYKNVSENLLHLSSVVCTLKMKAEFPLETMAPNYKSARQCIPENYNLHSHENLKI